MFDLVFANLLNKKLYNQIINKLTLNLSDVMHILLVYLSKVAQILNVHKSYITPFWLYFALQSLSYIYNDDKINKIFIE